MKHWRVKGKETQPSKSNNNISSQYCQWVNTISNFEDFWRYMKKRIIAFDEYHTVVMIHDVTASKNILAAKVKEGVRKLISLLTLVWTWPLSSADYWKYWFNCSLRLQDKEGRLLSNYLFLKTVGIFPNPRLLGSNGGEMEDGDWPKSWSNILD